ncbi:hypothetical protein GY45DRAFT_1374657 [Cubamyces sp. BRFM 1775]|nr:hypothetical protein GY45DRAFT_1374657 [Cubamyces sp. BRFM 1775]
MSDEAFVMELNNYCQENGLLIQWAEAQAGPQHALSWTVTVSLRGVEYGRGTARSKKNAKELAAEMALRALKGQSTAA